MNKNIYTVQLLIYTMLLGNLNLKGLVSELYNTLCENEHDNDNVNNIILNDIVSNDIIVQFNERVIIPENIIEILTLCDFLMIENTLQFIIDYCEPTFTRYKLNKHYIKHFLLPSYMKFLNITNVLQHDASRWFKFIHCTDVFIWSSDNDCMAANYGAINCLKYLHSINYQWTNDVAMFAARNGHLDCLQYLYENGCTRNDDNMTIATRQCHLNCIKFLHKNGHNIPKDARLNFVLNNRLDCLKYAHECDIVIDKMMYLTALVLNRFEIIEYYEHIDSSLKALSFNSHDTLNCIHAIDLHEHSDTLLVNKYDA